LVLRTKLGLLRKISYVIFIFLQLFEKFIGEIAMKGIGFKFLAVLAVFCLFTSTTQAFFGKKDKPKEPKQSSAATAPAAKQTETPPPPAEQKAQTPAVPSKARIKFETSEYDFGEVAPDSINNCIFKFTSTGEETLKIDHMQGTCKCTVPELAKKDYAPGESGEIKVEFHAPRYQGPTSQHVIVFSNDGEKPRAELEIKAYVKLAVSVMPESLNLSLLDPNAGTMPITIASNDGERFAITKTESQGNTIKFEIDPNNISDKHILKPIVNTAALRNNLMGSVIFTINHPKCKEVRLQWTCMKEFEASPSVIIIRNAEAGEVQKRSIFLTSNYNQPIEIESAVSDKGLVKVTNQVKTENRFQFDVDIVPPAREGQLRVFSDTLRIKIKGKEEIAIPCRGFYKINQ